MHRSLIWTISIGYFWPQNSHWKKINLFCILASLVLCVCVCNRGEGMLNKKANKSHHYITTSMIAIYYWLPILKD